MKGYHFKVINLTSNALKYMSSGHGLGKEEIMPVLESRIMYEKLALNEIMFFDIYCHLSNNNNVNVYC